ncbi:uncharacterized protein PHACADRAFT_204683 [Phanerochaete carnosa HHB-10118-sp]|uniref:DNA (cytosine-5-)-methyltransferase n=1 Tax=Phanerochaete carnosa (strain HHB-10118-sp) TaxID=650164 RepID=K5WC38_PHACS|nr:uncharacterized protein PHACADRAFT_204683 [Phanerochaete carnosa HHB-10118-sp]EKM61513.1 hypothetical protein PHACADRAFT_204683 [Phanerochaete carnosa HHB-10118-sp]
MPLRNRPTAWEVSSGESNARVSLNTSNNASPFARPSTRPPTSVYTPPNSSHRTSSPASSVGGSTLVGTPRDARGGKRTHGEWDEGVRGKGKKPDKRTRSSQQQKPQYYPESETYIHENGKNKPTRILTDFVIFDPGHDDELVSLEDLFDHTIDRSFEATGNVAPEFINEEDAGLDDDGFEDDLAKQRLRTSAIFSFTLDYNSSNSIYIQTQYARYALKTPAQIYSQIWFSFYRPHRVAQLIMSLASLDPQSCTRKKIHSRFIGTFHDDIKGIILEEDIGQADRVLFDVIQDNEAGYDRALQSPYMRDLRNSPLQPNGGRRAWGGGPRGSQHVDRTKPFNTINLDLLVLRPERQNSTTVTPLVAKLSDGLFLGEQFKLLVTAREQQTNEERRREFQQQRNQLLEFLRRASKPRTSIGFPNDGQVRPRSDFWNCVVLEDTTFKAGDVVLLPASKYKGRRTPEEIPPFVDERGYNIPEGRMIWDYFWFAQIMYFNQQRKKVHVRWFEHSSRSITQEIYDPRELFLTDICDDEDIRILVGKIDVVYRQRPLLKRLPGRFSPNPPRIPPDDTQYFYSFKYNEKDGSFLALGETDLRSPLAQPPNNCPVCIRQAAQEQENHPQAIESGAGIAFRGVNYHINDFVMIRTQDPVCMIGQIVGVAFDDSARAQGSCEVTIMPLGRVNDILQYCREETIVKDEASLLHIRRTAYADTTIQRHLYLTTSKVDSVVINANDLIRRCRVVNFFSVPNYWVCDVSAYLDQSPYNFYVKFKFPKLKVTSWSGVQELTRKSKVPEICAICFYEDKKLVENFKEFKQVKERRPFRAFDPFGGVGAFALAMQEAGCLKLTHAVELSPSAALTLKRNSPDTTVYNQCANLVLEHAVKTVRLPGYQLPPEYKPILKSDPTLSPLPPPPKPGDIDCIVAGFPWHVKLVMLLPKANDRKSHLILNLLSWVDFLEPKLCFFENVCGFLQYNLNSIQASRYKLEGGIQMGGLKFLVRALVTMGYQVKFAVLQAAHYGTPQTRVRFFLIAAQLGQPMPNFPAPLYSFTPKDALEIKFSHGLIARPINTENGIAPFRYVTVDDAIGDLLRWDWVNPRKGAERERRDPGTREAIRAVKVEQTKKAVGPLAAGTVKYHGPARTRFQEKARVKQSEIKDLQHITRVLKLDTVARVTLIPLEAKADYHALLKDKDIPRDLLEWHWADPKSAIARHGFRPGLYGRMDPNEWFQTTVTNVEPTAKQCKVLNPFCKRVVSVRELARSQGFPDHFQFYCYDTVNVKTMQREIGNAVPWPVGYALGRELRDALFEDWLRNRQQLPPLDAEVIILD